MYGFVTGGMGHLGAIRVPRRGMWGMGATTPPQKIISQISYVDARQLLQSQDNQTYGTVAFLSTVLSTPPFSYTVPPTDILPAIRLAMVDYVQAFTGADPSAIWAEIIKQGSSATVTTVAKAMANYTAAQVSAAQTAYPVLPFAPPTPVPASGSTAGSAAGGSAVGSASGSGTPSLSLPSGCFLYTQGQFAAMSPDQQQMAITSCSLTAPINASTALPIAQEPVYQPVAPDGTIATLAYSNPAQFAATVPQPAPPAALLAIENAPPVYMTPPSSSDTSTNAATVPMLDTSTGNVLASPSPSASPVASGGLPAVDIGSWFTQDSMISGIPNYAIAAGGGLLLLLLLKK